MAAMFDFLDEPELQKRLEAELYAARYIYKLGEALSVSDERLHAHVKFQIVQYAAIYEAIIVHLLWNIYSDHPAVTGIEYHTTFKKSAHLGSSLSLTLADSGEEIVLCTEARQKTSRVSIKFDDKVDAAVAIGFLDENLGEEVKTFYRLRNAIHLESAIRNQTNYELASSLLAFRRLLPFTRGIRGFLSTGVLPEEGRLKPQLPSSPSSNLG
ncbi:hypothetical protein [Rhizorhabdus sp.]|uniref:hypothetical protein n=1 Tax=Rhizorhabdus sp. TaxID=1968843 RepID=UPI0019B70B9B|nr:hypothetical protein [Rhizorhabdus sp.]MBD3761298.1 hypothetical protein [Rhizorhabdus sp.]